MSATIQELVPLLFVEDIGRSADFYRERLGFEMTMKWEPAGKLSWCRLEHGRASLMLQQALPEEDGPAEGRGRGVGFYFNCHDADAMHADLASRGLSLAAPKASFYGMNQLFVKDPDGYELCFQSVVERAR
jgi:uncharacterized glyoxalase superfamily protein PhnB